MIGAKEAGVRKGHSSRQTDMEAATSSRQKDPHLMGSLDQRSIGKYLEKFTKCWPM